jgi:mono/diheme cytochrome c family protein
MLVVSLCALVAASSLPAAEAATGEQIAFFESRVRPLLVENCHKCHGPKEHKGNLRLDSIAAILAGGDSGPAVVPGKPEESVLVSAINYRDYEMPPTGKLKQQQIDILTQWVKMGAPWPGGSGDTGPVVRPTTGEISEQDRQFWSFQPVKRPAVPAIAAHDAVDAFVHQKRTETGLNRSPEATRRELIRRATFDLLGLPPTLDEVDDFVEDDSPDAYERLIDRLLASPRYGERWGRHWLDLVRYAQSNGYERDDEKPLAWKYRDYVIRALNADKPYDQFVVEQLAGDELEPVTDDSISATAIYRLGVWDDEPDDKRAAEYEELDDIVSTIGSTFLGLTVGCARCHEHKFDPIPQEDYYRLLAFVRNIALYGNDQSETHKRPNPNGIFAALPSGKGNTLAVRSRKGKPQRTHLLVRGNAGTPGKEVEPGFLQVLFNAEGGVPTAPEPEAGDDNTLGLRRRLAEWIASPENPLTARVAVNRLWHYHFGRGIVATPSDFGRTGTKPSHPELLDYLASVLVEGGWQLKPLHRRVMRSAVYRQSSATNDAGQVKDPDNLLLWRQNLRRLEAEAIRDAALAVSGRLNLAMGGRGVFPTLPPEVLATQSRPGNGWGKSDEAEQSRRSVYLFVKRTLGIPILESFDFASPDKPIPGRATTTVAPQALILLNGSFFDEQADALAERLVREAPEGRREQIELAYRLAFSRAANELEVSIAIAYLDRHRASSEQTDGRAELVALAKLVLNLNEFVYID